MIDTIEYGSLESFAINKIDGYLRSNIDKYEGLVMEILTKVSKEPNFYKELIENIDDSLKTLKSKIPLDFIKFLEGIRSEYENLEKVNNSAKARVVQSTNADLTEFRQAEVIIPNDPIANA